MASQVTNGIPYRLAIATKILSAGSLWKVPGKEVLAIASSGDSGSGSIRQVTRIVK